MEYWYLWVAFAVLCVITVLVLRKASKAMRLHNDGQKKIYEEIDRLKVLKEKYKNADAEVIEAAEPRELLGGAYAVLQSALERDENPDTLFAVLPESCRYTYTLYCFVEDTEAQGLTFFFKNNGHTLLQYAVGALEAVRQEGLAALVRAEYAMLDENNEAVSLDAAKFEKFDADFRKIYDAEALMDSVKQYIFTHREEILG